MHSVESSRSATDVHELTLSDKRYPDRLRGLSDPPKLLYVRGDVELLARERLVAVVGTREPTIFGTSAAEELTGALADGGWGIVSGLARGIDTIAHRTALEHGVPTIAVMGGGLDSVYPAENKGLAAQIIDSGGALISEQPFGEQARPQHLIARDRLQSGLSVAVVVAQSGVRSGTMHTARFAATQGRPLFCPVPHNENAASEGLRVLLERPARELCSILPAWRGAKALTGSDPVSSEDALLLPASMHRASGSRRRRCDSNTLQPRSYARLSSKGNQSTHPTPDRYYPRGGGDALQRRPPYPAWRARSRTRARPEQMA